MKDKTETELKEILLTTDGKGKVIKEQALNELLERRYPSKVVCLPLANGEGLRGQRANVLIIDDLGGWKS